MAGLEILTSDATFEQKVLVVLTELHTDVKSLVGNGQPGRVMLIEQRLSGLEANTNKGSGAHGFVRWALPVVISLIAVAVAFAAFSKGH